MAITYTEGRSLASNLLADLNTAILANADWTRPNSGSRPTTYKCTTTRGADMVIDLADAAITTSRLQVAAYTSYDGTTLGDKTPGTNLAHFKGASSGTTATNWVYWTLSLSKEHFFLMVEGPRGMDANADSASVGSTRSAIFMCDLVPYFDSGTDPDPEIIVDFQSANDSAYSNNAHKCRVSHLTDGTPWGSGLLTTLEFPAAGYAPVANRFGLDGNRYLAPYVYFDDVEGLRGRLSSLFYAGTNVNGDGSPLSLPPVGSHVDYGGIRYKLLAIHKGGSNNVEVFSALGNAGTSSGVPFYSPIVAVPYADLP